MLFLNKSNLVRLKLKFLKNTNSLKQKAHEDLEGRKILGPAVLILIKLTNLSPCISICKSDPKTGFCFGCARTDEEKKIWKNPETTIEWKKENLKILTSRMSETQLKTFNNSYDEKNQIWKTSLFKI